MVILFIWSFRPFGVCLKSKLGIICMIYHFLHMAHPGGYFLHTEYAGGQWYLYKSCINSCRSDSWELLSLVWYLLFFFINMTICCPLFFNKIFLILFHKFKHSLWVMKIFLTAYIWIISLIISLCISSQSSGAPSIHWVPLIIYLQSQSTISTCGALLSTFHFFPQTYNIMWVRAI